MQNHEGTDSAPFFSIITVCLNAGSNLYVTIQSIIQQSYANYEIIVKDGGSSDESLLRIPQDKRIKIIITPDDGIYYAMNEALNKAIGKYILFLNAGDCFYNNDVLKLYYDSIQKNNWPNLLYGNYSIYGSNMVYNSPNRISAFFLFRTMLCHQVCMIKKETYDKIGHFDTSLKVVADYDYLLRLLYLNTANSIYINRILIISLPYGFSFKNEKVANLEVVKLRKKYYGWRYYRYSLLLNITLPKVRKTIIKNQYALFLYQSLVNAINRYL